ncbi:hypothetical protein F5I97DRAFT_1664860 [Phlebopus sp. FC_14]|nr:hypothetical protein F5I97DRAFT_1664860 [Phlebopus sp. FC_14]
MLQTYSVNLILRRPIFAHLASLFVSVLCPLGPVLFCRDPLGPPLETPGGNLRVRLLRTLAKSNCHHAKEIRPNYT